MDNPHTCSLPSIFRLPLELREEIYSHLLLPQHVYESSPSASPTTPSSHSRNGASSTRALYSVRSRRSKRVPFYADTRVYLPSQLHPNILKICKQLREESLTYHARRLNSRCHATVVDSNPHEETKSHNLGETVYPPSDDLTERHHDDGTVRITLEITREFRGPGGSYMPVRREPSPHFKHLLPLLSRLKKVKFAVWAGYKWWSGEATQPVIKVKRSQKARSSQASTDQYNRVRQPTLWEQENTHDDLIPRPNLLGVAIDALLQHLPLVEEVRVDVFIHFIEYWNWDLPETWWDGIRDWIDGPISPIAQGRVKEVDKRVVMVYIAKVGTLLYQHESLQENSTVRIERGHRGHELEWGGLQSELPFTETVERALPSTST